MRIPANSDDSRLLDILVINFDQTDRGVIDEKPASPSSFQARVMSYKQFDDIGMSNECQVGPNVFLSAPALDCRQRSLLHLGKRLDAFRGYCWIFDVRFPAGISFSEFIKILSRPAAYVCVHQTWLKLYGNTSSLNDNLRGLACSF